MLEKDDLTEFMDKNKTYDEFTFETCPCKNINTYYVVPQYLIDHYDININDLEQHIAEMKSEVQEVTVVQYIDDEQILCTNNKVYRYSNGWEIEGVNDTGLTRIIPTKFDLDYYIRVNVLKKIMEFQFSSYNYQITIGKMHQVYSIVKNSSYPLRESK